MANRAFNRVHNELVSQQLAGVQRTLAELDRQGYRVIGITTGFGPPWVQIEYSPGLRRLIASGQAHYSSPQLGCYHDGQCRVTWIEDNNEEAQ